MPASAVVIAIARFGFGDGAKAFGKVGAGKQGIEFSGAGLEIGAGPYGAEELAIGPDGRARAAPESYRIAFLAGRGEVLVGLKTFRSGFGKQPEVCRCSPCPRHLF